MTGTDLGLVALILGALILGMMGWSKRDARRDRLLSSGLPPPRHWRSRTPGDCAHCGTEALTLLAGAQQPPVVRPLRDGRSRRGAPRHIPTEGHAWLSLRRDYGQSNPRPGR
jgi:hypothetical protein